ncbi:hypothetical protein GF371_01385 [Candidatus Woesearchaeota archaeon]|nr:hypothetical protein [Candidatus Woesearchaeota archaeon]
MEPGKEQESIGYNRPGLARRLLNYPLTSLEIGSYLLKCALFGDNIDGSNPTEELERQLCAAYINNEDLPEETKALFWKAYKRLPKPENKQYNAVALVDRAVKGMSSAYKKGIWQSVKSFFSDKKARKTGQDIAEEFVKAYYGLESMKRTSASILNRFNNTLHSIEEKIASGEDNTAELQFSESPARLSNYDKFAVDAYLAIEDAIENASQRLGLYHENDPWKRIFILLWNKTSVDYSFTDSLAAVTDWKGAAKEFNSRMQDMQKIAKRTGHPSVAKDMLKVLVKDTHQAVYRQILSRFEKGAHDQENNEQLDRLVKFYTSISLAHRNLLYPDLKINRKRKRQRRRLFINNIVRTDLIDRLTNLDLGQLNGHLNVRYLSGLIQSYDRFVRSLCPNDTESLNKELLAIAQHFRKQLYDTAIDLHYSKDSEHIRRPELSRFKKLYERFCFKNRQVFQPEDMPNKEFRKIIHQDLNGLKKAGRIRQRQRKQEQRKQEAEKQSLIIKIANLMQADVDKGLLEQCGQTILEDFVEYFKDSHRAMGKTFEQFLEERELFKPDEIDWADLASLEQTAMAVAANVQPEFEFGMFDLAPNTGSANQKESSIFNPIFYHPDTGEEISSQEFKEIMDKKENADS